MHFDEVSYRVAERCHWYRQKAGWTRQQLADRCHELGSDITFAVVTSIESGRRNSSTGRRTRDVTVDELFVLSRALGVPPVELLFDVDHPDQLAAVSPGIEVDAWSAIKWVSAEGPFPYSRAEFDKYGSGDWDPRTELFRTYDLPPEADRIAPGRGATGSPVDLMRRHAAAWELWWLSLNTAAQLRSAAEDATADSTRVRFGIEADAEDARRRDVLERDLAVLRRRLREYGLRPWPLPEEMTHIDERAEAKRA